LLLLLSGYILYIYERAEEECYPNYMEGAKALYKYLSPIGIPDTHALRRMKTPSCFYSYETQELEKITGLSQEVLVATLIKEVMQRV